MRPRPRGPEVFPFTVRPLDKLSLGRSVPDQYCGSKMIFFGFGSGLGFGLFRCFRIQIRIWILFRILLDISSKNRILKKLVHFVEILWIVNFIGSGSGQKFRMRPKSGSRSGSGSSTLLAETWITPSPLWGIRGNPSFAHINRHMACIQYARPLASTVLTYPNLYKGCIV
jgi:hypothetical protein